MPEPLTKAEEIRIYEEFVGSLPEESYLHEILGRTVPEVTYEIQSDFSYSLRNFLQQATADRLNLTNEIAQLTMDRDKLKTEIDCLRRDLVGLDQKWAEAKEKMKAIWFAMSTTRLS